MQSGKQMTLSLSQLFFKSCLSTQLSSKKMLNGNLLKEAFS